MSNILKNKKRVSSSSKSNKNQLDFSSVIVVYKSKEDVYRGFVQPYDITYEDETSEKVLAALKEMIVEYEKGLKKYNNPPHLKAVPLSDKEDREKWNEITPDLMPELFSKNLEIARPTYYAEAQLPA